MGLFNIMKQVIAFRKAFKEQVQREAEYVQMANAELSTLSDDELFRAVWARTEKLVSAKEDLLEGFHSLNEEQRIFYAVNYLEMEVNNGGLCQFFVNSSRMIAPYVSEYMAVIGADSHKELFDQFIIRHNIDLQDLTSFCIEKIEDYQKQYERYPFDEYDNVFYELEPLQNYLVPFVKNIWKNSKTRSGWDSIRFVPVQFFDTLKNRSLIGSDFLISPKITNR